MGPTEGSAAWAHRCRASVFGQHFALCLVWCKQFDRECLGYEAALVAAGAFKWDQLGSN